MPKCWIHGPATTDEGGEEEKKKSKPLKEHPGFPDNGDNYKQNLEIILSPKRKEIDFEKLNKKLAKTEQEKEYYEKKNETYKKQQEKLEQDIKQGQKYFEFVSWREKGKDEKISSLEKDLKNKEEDISKKDKQIQDQVRRLKKAVEIFKEHEKKIKAQELLLNKEKKTIGTQTDFEDHVKKDLQNLENEKTSLAKTIKDLEEQVQSDKLARDKEIEELKEKVAKQAQTIKDLTEVKMKREESEERLRKQSKDFLNVQNMNKMVYDILGEYSTENGLYLRSKEVVGKIKLLINEKNSLFSQVISAQNQVSSLSSQLQKELGWWDKWINDKIHWSNTTPVTSSTIVKNTVIIGINTEKKATLTFDSDEDFFSGKEKEEMVKKIKKIYQFYQGL